MIFAIRRGVVHTQMDQKWCWRIYWGDYGNKLGHVKQIPCNLWPRPTCIIPFYWLRGIVRNSCEGINWIISWQVHGIESHWNWLLKMIGVSVQNDLEFGNVFLVEKSESENMFKRLCRRDRKRLKSKGLQKSYSLKQRLGNSQANPVPPSKLPGKLSETHLHQMCQCRPTSDLQ